MAGYWVLMTLFVLSFISSVEISVWFAKPFYRLYPESIDFDRAVAYQMARFRQCLRGEDRSTIVKRVSRSYGKFLAAILRTHFGFWLAFSLFFVLNVIALWFAYAAIQAPQFMRIEDVRIGVENAYRGLDFLSVLHLSLISGFCGATIDMTSILISQHLICKASEAKRKVHFFIMLLAEVCLAILACGFTVLVVAVGLKNNYFDLIDSIRNPLLYFRMSFWDTVAINPHVLISVPVMGVTALMPTCGYFVVLLLSLIAKAAPCKGKISDFMQRVTKIVVSDVRKGFSFLLLARRYTLWFIARPGAIVTVGFALKWLIVG